MNEKTRWRLLIQTERMLVDRDGEIPGTLPATVEVVPGALRLMTGA